MKTLKLLMYFAVMAAITFTSCKKDSTDDGGGDNPQPTSKTNIAYVLNYGSYSGANGEISIYDRDSKELTDTAGYTTINGVDFSSKIESATIIGDKMYIMSNNGDKIDIINANTLKQTQNPIAVDITKPRFMVESNGIGYISCWGDVAVWAVMANSYIAKMDLATNAITKINIPGGLEGMAIVNNTLYIAQSARNTIITMDLSNDNIDSIKTPAIPQQFAVGNDGKLYVSLVSKFSTPYHKDSLGVAVINTSNNTIERKIDLPGIGGNGFIHISSDKNTLYVLSNKWNAAFTGTISALSTIDLSNDNISEILNGESFSGFNLEPTTDNIYLTITTSTTENGKLKIYSKTGSEIDSEDVLISPKHILFHQIQ